MRKIQILHKPFLHGATGSTILTKSMFNVSNIDSDRISIGPVSHGITKN